jgi:hypothetical protein
MGPWPHSSSISTRSAEPERRSRVARVCRRGAGPNRIGTSGGCSSMVELQLPKLLTWVRFPSPAPHPVASEQPRSQAGGVRAARPRLPAPGRRIPPMRRRDRLDRPSITNTSQEWLALSRLDRRSIDETLTRSAEPPMRPSEPRRSPPFRGSPMESRHPQAGLVQRCNSSFRDVGPYRSGRIVRRHKFVQKRTDRRRSVAHQQRYESSRNFVSPEILTMLPHRNS